MVWVRAWVWVELQREVSEPSKFHQRRKKTVIPNKKFSYT